MECLNDFCIYQKDDECILDEIEIGTSGICQSCIYPDIPPEILEQEKEKLIKRYEEDE